MVSPGSGASPNGGPDLDGGDLVSWLNCECFFSLVLVGLLAALPFNLHTQELMQTPETYVARAMELSGDGAFDKVCMGDRLAATTKRLLKIRQTLLFYRLDLYLWQHTAHIARTLTLVFDWCVFVVVMSAKRMHAS